MISQFDTHQQQQRRRQRNINNNDDNNIIINNNTNSASDGACIPACGHVVHVCAFNLQVNVGDNRHGVGQAPQPPEDGKRKARQVDKISRKIFPTAFAIFNFVYWFIYADPFRSGKQEKSN